MLTMAAMICPDDLRLHMRNLVHRGLGWPSHPVTAGKGLGQQLSYPTPPKVADSCGVASPSVAPWRAQSPSGAH
jgi:hypothetical protein